MATFQLQDGFGLNETIVPGNSALSKYFNDLPDWQVAVIDLAQLATTDLTNPAVNSAEGGVTFSRPIELGASGTDLTVGASASANLSIFVPASNDALLFDPDTFGDPIKVNTNERYVSVALTAEVTAGANPSSGDLKFGFDGKTNVTLTSYEKFAAGTTVLSAVKDTISNFVIPGDLDDILAMPQGSIATVQSTGSLEISATANLLAVTNPLASTALPGLGTIGVTAGSSLSIGADFTFSGDYQLRVQRLQGHTCHIGFYAEKDSDFDVSVSASASITAKLGDNELISQLFQKISADPSLDLAALEAAGLTPDQSKAIQSAVKGAIDRTLTIGMKLEISRTSTSDALFLYEVDLNAVRPDGRKALNDALEGSLTGLVASGSDLIGIKVLKSVISKSRTLQHSLKINLLGIYNVLSLSQLMVSGTQAYDPNIGEIVFTDSATANRITAIASNFAINNSNKLRRILAQHFVITAVYRAAANGDKIIGGPELNGFQTYFDLEGNPSKVRMRDYLLMTSAMGLQSAAGALNMLKPSLDDYGNTTVYAEMSFDLNACRALFFDANARLLNSSLYISAGRAAITDIVRSGDSDDFRLSLATNDQLFNALSEIGNVSADQFKEACTNAGVPAAMVPVVGTDFLNIIGFSNAMTKAGQGLEAIENFLSANPNVDTNNHSFINLKQKLANTLGKVVTNSTVDFGGPWGFDTIAQLRKTTAQKWLILNKFITATLPLAGAQ